VCWTLGRSLSVVLFLSVLACSTPAPRDSSAAAPPAPRSERQLAGLLRSDGFVVPFAEQIDGRWTLPGVSAAPDGTAELADRSAAWFASTAVPSGWRYVTLTGRSGALATSTPVQTRSHCQSIWALASDLRAEPLRESEVHTAAGVATTSGATLEPFVTLPNDSGEAARVRSWLTPLFDRDEQAAATNAPRRDPPLPTAADRQQQPIAIERIVRSKSAVGGRALYYVEAVRQFETGARRGSRGDCGPQSFWTGWLSEVPATGELAVITSHLDLTDCDRKGSSLTIPLGLLRSGADVVVITTDRLWESEQYVIYATDGRTMRQLIRAAGGGC